MHIYIFTHIYIYPKIEFTYYKINSSIIYNSVLFKIFIELHNHLDYLIPEYVITQKKPYTY